MKRLVLCVFLLSTFLLFQTCHSKSPDLTLCKGDARCFEGAVNKVIDGDTLEISGETVRLSLVNTPEKTQAGFYESKDESENLCPIGSIAVVDEDDDQTSRSHRRIIGVVYCRNGTVNLNKALLDSGKGSIVAGFCNKSEFSREEWAVRNGC